MKKVLPFIGFILFILGAGGMDSECVILPMASFGTGLLILYRSANYTKKIDPAFSSDGQSLFK